MDMLILLQAILYFFIFILGFFVCIPVGVNRSNFDGICILYSEAHLAKKGIYVTGGTNTNCNFAIYFSVFGMLIFGLVAGLCFLFFALRSRNDKDVGTGMWTLPFIPLNAVLAFITLVTACILSVGFHLFCGSVKDLSEDYKSCTVLEHQTFNNNTNTGSFVGLSSLSQAGAWIGFLLYLVQTAVGVFRYLQNRRKRQRNRRESHT